MRYITIVFLLVVTTLYSSASFFEPPIHGYVKPMETVSPYNIITSVSSAHQNEIFTIRIKSILSGLNVGGFVVRAHSATEPNKILGKFSASSVGLQMNSFDGKDQSVAYHAFPGTVDEVQLQWHAPNDFVGEILFNATVAQDSENFWVGITSAPVEILNNEAETLKSYFTSSMVRSNQSSIGDDKVHQRNIALIYDGCGTTKTCAGVPNNCITTQSCLAVATAFALGNRYRFELQSFDDRIAYVAVGLSQDGRMGEDSVMECVNEEGTARAHTSYNNPRGNTRDGVPQNIISTLDASLVDGLVYCNLERQAVTTVLGVEFNLPNENYHFLMSIGTSLSNSLVSYHDLGQAASNQPLQIIERPVDNSIYEGCGLTKTCFGMPLNCVPLQTCEAIVTATIVDDRHQFELESRAAGVNWIALGLSRDTLMGNDSVTECIRQNDVVRLYNSWNERRTNYRDDVPQNKTTLLSSSLVNGIIYCKYEQQPATSVRDHDFDLLNEDFHFLVAIGTTLTESAMVTRHDLGRLASPQPLTIIRQIDPIYHGCGTEKTCYGMPHGCLSNGTCEAIVTVVVEDEERYEFELQSGVTGVRYVSFGLSRDHMMGEDSVIECVANGNIVAAFTSWNTDVYTNTRVEVPQNIITLLSSSLNNGKIYCKLEREASTVVHGHAFDLDNEDFHFLLATGTDFTANAILMHDLGRSASDDRFDLPGRRSSAPNVLRISAIAVVVWLMVTSCANFLR